MSEWLEKNWGKVKHDFSNEIYCTSHLEVIKGQRSSIHYHEDRHNLFLVVDACIAVECFGAGEKPNTERGGFSWVTLYPGHMFQVQPGVWHRFRTLKPGRVLEMYWADRDRTVRIDDIIRHDVGGVDRD